MSLPISSTLFYYGIATYLLFLCIGGPQSLNKRLAGQSAQESLDPAEASPKITATLVLMWGLISSKCEESLALFEALAFYVYLNYCLASKEENNIRSQSSLSLVIITLYLLVVSSRMCGFFGSYLLVEGLTLLCLAFLVTRLEVNASVVYLLVSMTSTLIMLVALALGIQGYVKSYSLLVIVFSSLKIGLLPLGYWISYFYDNLTPQSLQSYLLYFYLPTILAFRFLLTNTFFAELGQSATNLNNAFLAITLASSPMYLWGYGSGKIRELIKMSSWTLALMLLITI